jgi:hypothetical protein
LKFNYQLLFILSFKIKQKLIKNKERRISHDHDLDNLSKTQLENGDLGFDAWDLKSFLKKKKSKENIFT